jgi:hypothetical protein
MENYNIEEPYFAQEKNTRSNKIASGKALFRKSQVMSSCSTEGKKGGASTLVGVRTFAKKC